MDTSPLNRLPHSVRDKTYELVLCPIPTLSVSAADDRLRLWSGLYVLTFRKHFLAITATCKEIRKEASRVFYGANTFQTKVQAFDNAGLSCPWRFNRKSVRFVDSPTQAYGYSSERTDVEVDRQQWVEGLKAWLDQIGPANASSLGEVEVILGSWQLLRPQRAETDIARALKQMMQLFEGTTTKLSIIIHIMIPTASDIQYVRNPKLPIRDTVEATDRLKRLFSDQLEQLDRQWTQNKVSFAAFQVLKRAIEECRRRLVSFVQAIADPPPQRSNHDLTKGAEVRSISAQEKKVEPLHSSLRAGPRITTSHEVQQSRDSRRLSWVPEPPDGAAKLVEDKEWKGEVTTKIWAGPAKKQKESVLSKMWRF